MLRHMQAIDAGLVGGLGEGEPLVEERSERPLAMLDVVEKSDLHQGPGTRIGTQWISGSGIRPPPARKSKSQPSSA
jgi:hypothetical protein